MSRTPEVHAAAAHQRHDRAAGATLDTIALMATPHCLSGCAIDEVLGMVIGTALELSNAAAIALAVVLAFFLATPRPCCSSCAPAWR